MEFRTQHKNFTAVRDGSKKESYRAHRDGKQVWVTSAERGGVVFNEDMATASQAKKFMNSPHA